MIAEQLSLFDVGPRLSILADFPCTAAPIGTGPAGETCKTCHHYTRLEYRSGTFLKCGLMERHWTHGRATDIRAGWPACRAWERIEPAATAAHVLTE